jgi:hypothetical protein
MKKIALLALGVLASATIAGAANAADGCGPGFHRNAWGHCRPNGVVVAPGLVVGTFYPGHGYWDGHRYWGHRYGYHGGWRYR